MKDAIYVRGYEIEDDVYEYENILKDKYGIEVDPDNFEQMLEEDFKTYVLHAKTEISKEGWLFINIYATGKEYMKKEFELAINY